MNGFSVNKDNTAVSEQLLNLKLPENACVEYAFFASFDGMSISKLRDVICALPGGNRLIRDGKFDAVCGAKNALRDTDILLSELIMKRVHIYFCDKGSFHPKIYLFRYSYICNNNTKHTWRLMLGSKNITNDSYLDAFVMFEGNECDDKAEKAPNGAELYDIIKMYFTDSSDTEPEKLKKTDFSLFEQPYGSICKSIRFLSPDTDPDLLKRILKGNKYDCPLYVISPFVSSFEKYDEDYDIKKNVVLLSREEELAKQKFLPERVFFFNTSADKEKSENIKDKALSQFVTDFSCFAPPAAGRNSEGRAAAGNARSCNALNNTLKNCQISTINRDTAKDNLKLHGKVYIKKDGDNTVLYIGSANFTNSAFNDNKEILAELTFKGGIIYDSLKDGLEEDIEHCIWKKYKSENNSDENGSDSKAVNMGELNRIYKCIKENLLLLKVEEKWKYEFNTKELEQLSGAKVISIKPVSGITQNGTVTFEYNDKIYNYAFNVVNLLNDDKKELFEKELKNKINNELELQKQEIFRTGGRYRSKGIVKKEKESKVNKEYEEIARPGMFEFIRKLVRKYPNSSDNNDIIRENLQYVLSNIVTELTEEEKNLYELIVKGRKNE